MKELMPSTYRMMKKRRGEQVLSSSIDSTLRMPSSCLPNRGFGIRKVNTKETTKELRSSKFKDAFEKTRASLSEYEHMQLISYCLGTAPSKYKIDTTAINNQVMNLFSEKKEDEMGEKIKEDIEGI